MSKRSKSQVELPPQLPIKLGPASNGEFIPEPISAETLKTQRVALELADQNARLTGQSRRSFLASACGAATTLFAMNQVLACAPRSGGTYRIPDEATVEPEAAQAAIGGEDFIFDVQTHHVNPARDWMERNHAFDFLQQTARGWCDDGRFFDCYGRDRFIKEVFFDSDTDLAVLSALAEVPSNNPLTIEEAVATREAVDRAGKGRLFLHGIVLPNGGPLQAQLDGMQHLTETHQVSAFKLYTVWGPKGQGFWLDDPTLGFPVLERARQLGVKNIAIHKGLSLPMMDRTFSQCRDIGPAAKAFPDLNFLVYHSGLEYGVPEQAYDPANAIWGVNSLIKSLADNGIGPNGNVYAELGATWKILMGRPDVAAHVLGKLLKHLGPERILWGTDSIWFGSPQDQIQAFRAFELTPELQEAHAYPALTKEVKRKIFGLNGARVYGVDVPTAVAQLRGDALAQTRRVYSQDPQPSFTTYGPTTRREVLELWRQTGGKP